MEERINFNHDLQNEIVQLRPIVMSDYGAFLRISADPGLWTWFTDDLSEPEILFEWVSEAVRDTETERRLAFTVIDKRTNSIAGSSSFGNISYRDSRMEIGWTWLGREWHGKGLNQAIKFLMLRHSFEILDFERVEAKTDVLNIPARKGLERAGMTAEGILRSHTLMTNQRRRDTIYYSILKAEWPERKKLFT